LGGVIGMASTTVIAEWIRAYYQNELVIFGVIVVPRGVSGYVDRWAWEAAAPLLFVIHTHPLDSSSMIGKIVADIVETTTAGGGGGIIDWITVIISLDPPTAAQIDLGFRLGSGSVACGTL
jgi:hypothetical protein